MAYYVRVGSVTLGMDVLLDVKVHLAHAMVGETLEADTLTLTYREKDRDPPEGFVPADTDEVMLAADEEDFWVSGAYQPTGMNPKALTSGTIMDCYANDSLIGRYYFDSYKQTGKNKYTLYGLSAIGILANQKHYGGMYINTTVAEVLADILQGFPYTIDASIVNNTITGYLPVASKRDNLQQVLFAVGATISNNAQGILQIYVMPNAVTATLDKSKCFLEGNVQLSDPVTGVQLIEHNYFKSSETTTLFDDSIYGTETIEFSEPYHSLSISGATIMASGVNYATISGDGSVVLTGKKYTHVTRVVSAANSRNGNVKSVNNAYLANPAVAQSLADRVFAYLRNNITISQDIMFTQERAGDIVKVINPYTEKLVTACAKELDITLSNLQRAAGKFLVGFVPQGSISGYTNHVLLTDSGNWVVPAGVTKIRLILVGGGSGGGGGKDGSDGDDGSWSGGTGSSYNGAGGTATGGAGGAGGTAGKAGAGGQVFEMSVDVTPGQVFNFSCGTGGIGGVANGGDGTAGGATTFGVYSSASGRKYPSGYTEAKTGLTFAQEGEAGFAGGRGGTAASTDGYGKDGESVNGFAGGKGSATITEYSGPDDRNTDYHTGGGGGGATNGAVGENASRSGAGGNGVTGTVGVDATNYGQGGGGGNGGGGGGGGGVGYTHSAVGSNPFYYYILDGGSAGKGTAGGNGGNGCIVVYY